MLKTVISLTLLALMTEACHSKKTSEKSEASSSQKSEPIKGSYRATQILGFRNRNEAAVNSGVKLLEKDINHELMSINIDLNKEGDGTISGTSLCGQLHNPITEKHSLLIISFGLSTGASLVSTPADQDECEKSKKARVESVLKVQHKKDLKGLPAKSLHNAAHLPVDMGFDPLFQKTFVSFLSRFDAVDSKCREMKNVKYITVMNSTDEREQAQACLGMPSGDANKLRLILLPVDYKTEPYTFVVDFERVRETK